MTVPRMRSVFGVVVSLVIVGTVPAAFAQTKPPAAANAEAVAQSKRLLATAAKLKTQGAAELAAEQFEAAYRLAPAAATLREALECYKQLGQAANQLAAAQRLLDKHGKELGRTEQTALKKLVEAAKGNIGQMELVAESGATVTLDEKELGTTPLSGPVSADAGKHVLVLKKEGFELWEKPIDVTARQTLSVEAKLEPTITTADISVKEASGKAVTVVIDGKEVGPAPYQGKLPLGKHQVSLQSPTHAAPPKDVDLVKRQLADVVLEAAPTTGRLDVTTSDKRGIVRVDGKLVGDGSFSGDLTSGEHLVEVTRDGFKAFSEKVAIESGKGRTVTVTLERIGPVVAEEPGEDSGMYGAIRLAGQLQLSRAGNELQMTCSKLTDPDSSFPPGTTPPANTCTSGSPAGGGIFGLLGYGWRYFGIEMLLGATGDITRGTANIQGQKDNSYDILRLGGMAALRARGMLQTKAFRFMIAAGPGVAERAALTDGESTNYFSPAFSADLGIGIRFSKTTTFMLGSMFWLEGAGRPGAAVSREEQSEFRLFSGTQTMLLPYVGFEFGPPTKSY